MALNPVTIILLLTIYNEKFHAFSLAPRIFDFGQIPSGFLRVQTSNNVLLANILTPKAILAWNTKECFDE